MGSLVPGSARANVISVMLCNTVVSQAVGIMQDYKTALYLQLRSRNMFIAQLYGASIGVLISATMCVGTTVFVYYVLLGCSLSVVGVVVWLLGWLGCALRLR